ncbi:hypothetical protein Tco_1553344, partial [Tanacetum coccineum]
VLFLVADLHVQLRINAGGCGFSGRDAIISLWCMGFLTVSGGASDFGLWDEDNTCWTKSFPMSSSSYVKSLSGRVSVWVSSYLSGSITVRHIREQYPL